MDPQPKTASDLYGGEFRGRRRRHRPEIIEGATHLFGEPGTLDQVAALARIWFQRHLKSAQS